MLVGGCGRRPLARVVGDGSNPDVGGAGKRLLAELVVLAASRLRLVLHVAAARMANGGSHSRGRAPTARTRSRALVRRSAESRGRRRGWAGADRTQGSPLVRGERASSTGSCSVSAARERIGQLSSRVLACRLAWRQSGNPCTGRAPEASSESGWRSGRSTRTIRNAHNLYLEVLAELGWVGLLILGATLVVPLTAVMRARSRPLMPAAVGVYVAYLAHASVDWDWQVPALTILALAAGAVMIVAARDGSLRLSDARPCASSALCDRRPRRCGGGRDPRRREAARSARRSLERGNVVSAANKAVAAERWLPWASRAVAGAR